MNREQQIRDWARDHGIFDKSDPKTQCLKTVSEVGELADNVAKGLDTRDDIGDIIVTLVILAAMKGTSIDECVDVAWAEIEHRRGSMQNGTFVKDFEPSLMIDALEAEPGEPRRSRPASVRRGGA